MCSGGRHSQRTILFVYLVEDAKIHLSEVGGTDHRFADHVRASSVPLTAGLCFEQCLVQDKMVGRTARLLVNTPSRRGLGSCKGLCNLGCLAEERCVVCSQLSYCALS